MSASAAGGPITFEIKSANLPLVALILKTTHLETLLADWDRQYGDMPDFFDQDPLVLDLSHVAGDDTTPIDFKKLLKLLRDHRVCPVAVKGGSDAQMKAALKAGLVAAPDLVLAKAPKPPAPVASPAPEQQAAAQPAPEPVAPPEVVAGPPLPAMVIDKPLRSGQQVYARGRDLVVLAMVNPGAEVIADGHVHVYAPLRGKAIAGARGNTEARIFALAMEPELISIAGVYRTSDVPLGPDVAGKPAMVRLSTGPDGDKLVMEAIKA